MSLHPSWGDVSVPLLLVNFIKTLTPCYTLDSLIHQFVARNRRKPSYLYRCKQCGCMYQPERSSEDVTECNHCGCIPVSCYAKLGWGREVPRYSRKTNYLDNLLGAMFDNYLYYFGKAPLTLLDCGWEEVNLYAQFLGGERVKDLSPRTCVAKAAVLCPYLWDMRFAWNEPPRRDTMNTDQISPALCNLATVLAGRSE